MCMIVNIIIFIIYILNYILQNKLPQDECYYILLLYVIIFNCVCVIDRNLFNTYCVILLVYICAR